MFHHLDFNIVSKALVETDPLMCHFTLGACDVVVWRRRPYFFIPSQHDSGVLHFAPCLARVFWSNQIPHCCWTELLAEKVCLTFTRKSLQLTHFNLLSLCCSAAPLRPSFFSICSLPIPARLSCLFLPLLSRNPHKITWAVTSSLPSYSLPFCFSVAGDFRR